MRLKDKEITNFDEIVAVDANATQCALASTAENNLTWCLYPLGMRLWTENCHLDPRRNGGHEE